MPKPKGVCRRRSRAPPKIFIGAKVHGSTFAFRATGFLPVKFGHALVHVHTYGKSMSMVW